ncbi:MAG: HipA domain-containing protein, partial [Candidatus Desulfovibrio faecigallinarum]|nr:HipA domain-containing protein [Candidatus Desulfovibrio faecigallinarum]
FLREALGWRLSPVYDLETSHPGEKAPMLHTCMIDEESVLDVNTALEIAEFFRLCASEARERLNEIRKAVSFWKQEAVRVNAKPAEIAVMKEAYEYCL